jgi:hypothetical protein
VSVVRGTREIELKLPSHRWGSIQKSRIFFSLNYPFVSKKIIFRESAQESDFAPLFGDLSQTEKLSEIKLPLVIVKE